MIKKYFEFLQGIFNRITTGGGDFTFGDYLKTIGGTIGILVLVVLCIFVLYFIVKGPYFCYKRFVHPWKKEIEATETQEAYVVAHNRWRLYQIIYAVLLVVIYIPIVVPTLLYIVYLLFHI